MEFYIVGVVATIIGLVTAFVDKDFQDLKFFLLCCVFFCALLAGIAYLVFFAF